MREFIATMLLAVPIALIMWWMASVHERPPWFVLVSIGMSSVMLSEAWIKFMGLIIVSKGPKQSAINTDQTP